MEIYAVKESKTVGYAGGIGNKSIKESKHSLKIWQVCSVANATHLQLPAPNGAVTVVPLTDEIRQWFQSQPRVGSELNFSELSSEPPQEIKDLLQAYWLAEIGKPLPISL